MSRAQEYMDQIDCDVYNKDTSLSDLQELARLLEKYIEKLIHE